MAALPDGSRLRAFALGENVLPVRQRADLTTHCRDPTVSARYHAVEPGHLPAQRQRFGRKWRHRALARHQELPADATELAVHERDRRAARDL